MHFRVRPAQLRRSLTVVAGAATLAAADMSSVEIAAAAATMLKGSGPEGASKADGRTSPAKQDFTAGR